MAIAAYDSDLTSTNSGEIAVGNTGTDGGTWAESSNATWDDAGSPADETNKYINNTNCISAQFTKAGQGTIIYDDGTTHAVDTDGAILIWAFWDSPPSLSTYANGGIKVLAGTGVGDFYAWDCGGSDFEPSPYAGWYCYAINPNFAASTIPYDDQVGTPGSAPYDTFGMAINASAQARGYPFAVNAIRVGRCTLEVTDGQASAYGSFSGMATFDLSTNQRYGLFYQIPGSGAYRWQGLMKLGTTTAVDFRDGNVSIAVANTPNVTANFNLIQINNSSSNVEWTNVVMTSPGVNDTVAATASRGDFNVVDNATVDLEGCSFTDMGTFTFNDGTNSNTITNTTFRRCNLITTGGATITDCIVDSTNDSTKAVIVSSPANAAKISGTSFTSTGTGHGLEIGGTAANFELTGCDFSGYDTANPGTAANKAIYVNISSGTVNITISGGSGVTESYHVRTAGATVGVIVGAVTVQATVTSAAGTAVESARVMIEARAKSSGTATTDTASKLVDTNATFQTDGVVAGDIAFNQTDGTSATVSAVDSETSLSLGSDAFPDGNEDYRVGGSFPVEDTVTISNSGTTATVTHTAHGMASNDYVQIWGGTLTANEGIFQITYISANSYSYTMLSTPGSSPTGTINATYVALYGTTNSSGQLSTTRVYSVDQPIVGWARKSSASPFYKEGPITGTIDSDDGLLATAVLVSDE